MKIKEKQLKKQFQIAENYIKKLSDLIPEDGYIAIRPSFNLLNENDYQCIIAKDPDSRLYLVFNVERRFIFITELLDNTFFYIKNYLENELDYGLDNENKRRIYNCLFYSNKELKKLLKKYKQMKG